MTSVGWATLDVIPSFKGLQRELDKGTTGPLRDAGTKGGTIFGDAAGKAGGSRFGQVFKNAAKAGLVGLAAIGAGAIKLGIDSISAASDLEESTNKVTQVFGDAADSVLKFTSTTADALGQTNNEARDAAATFGIFGSAAGLADKKNARFAKRMTTLASDLASFNNTDPSQAVEALGAALRGESEPIRAYGVMLDEATLKAEALRLGILKPVKDQSKIFAYQTRITDLQGQYNDAVKENGKGSLEALKAEAALGTARTALQKATEGTLPPLTQQQKLLAAQSEIFKQTDVAQGDFARTSDGLANQQRRLSARFEDAKAALGKGLLPIMTDAADFLLDKGIPAFERFADWFTKDGIPAIKKFGDKAKVVGGHVADLVGLLKDLPDPAKYAGLAALLGGGAALKVRGGKGGALGLAGQALNVAKPMRVFETNPLALGGGGGVGGVIPGGASKGKLALSAAKLTVVGAVALYAGDLYLKRARSSEGYTNNSNKDATDPNSVYADPKRRLSSDKLAIYLDAMEKKAQGLGRELDLVGGKKVEPLFAVPGLAKGRAGLQEFLRLQINAGKPITPYIDTTSIERAIQQARTLNATLAGNTVPTAGVDNGVGFQHGDTGDVRGGTGRVNANVYIGNQTVVAHDYDDFTKQSRRTHQQSSLGGVGR